MERGAFNNLIVAHAQVWGMYLALGALIWFTSIILLGHSKLDPTTEKLAYTLLGVLGAKFGDMISYFYNRQRPDNGPAISPPNDGNTTSEKSTTTTSSSFTTPAQENKS